MPIFEYECENCGNVFEELVMGSGSDISCSKCKSKKVKKLISAPVALESNQDVSGGLSAASSTCGSGGFS